MKRWLDRISVAIWIVVAILVAVLLSYVVRMPSYQPVKVVETRESWEEETKEIVLDGTQEVDAETDVGADQTETSGETEGEKPSEGEDASALAAESSLAEESRKAMEASAAADASSAAAEASSKAAEESKKAEESSKAAEESSKAAEESSKAAAESKQAAEESSKAAAESSKAAEESSKAAAESKKAAEESSKAAAESQKAVITASRTAGSKVSKSEVDASGKDAWFTISPISDSVFSRMKGKSFGSNCTIARDDLRYLNVLHYGRNGNIYVGELVCHKDIASSLSSIFKELYNNKYPIQKMYLVDDYGADDIASAAANNTSCFNFRISAGDGGGLSRHAYGKAIDINPLYNPYVWTDAQGVQRCDPSNGSEYVDRSKDYPYKLDADDLCVKIFKKYGFQWGGDWKYEKDYMHFSVP